MRRIKMAVEFRKFPSIEQYRNVIKQVSDRAKFHNIERPTLTFTGTVKLHGTNACVSYNRNTQEFGFQSRERMLSLTSDNAGFYAWGNKDSSKDAILHIVNVVWMEYHGTEINWNTVHVYGEWAGNGIMKGVGIAELPKAFYIFSIVFDGIEHELPLLANQTNDVRLITKYPTFTIDIDFNSPEAVQNTLVDATLAVEEKCPVASAHGIEGIGEGIVWWNKEYNLRFKTKGEKHSKSKVTKLNSVAPIDIEKMESYRQFVDKTANNARLEQGLYKLTEMGLDNKEMKNVGEYIRWVVTDILREEEDTIVANDIDAKKISRSIADVARKYYINALDFNV
jgi:hypothetical protein